MTKLEYQMKRVSARRPFATYKAISVDLQVGKPINANLVRKGVNKSRKPTSVAALTEFGRTRLSNTFFMRDFLFSDIAAVHGHSNTGPRGHIDLYSFTVLRTPASLPPRVG